jgi:hypothetical protein
MNTLFGLAAEARLCASAGAAETISAVNAITARGWHRIS